MDLVLNEFDILPLSNDVISYYAELRTFLERKGQIIGANDLLIASHSLAVNTTLITANIGEFSRIPKLKTENWLD